MKVPIYNAKEQEEAHIIENAKVLNSQIKKFSTAIYHLIHL